MQTVTGKELLIGLMLRANSQLLLILQRRVSFRFVIFHLISAKDVLTFKGDKILRNSSLFCALDIFIVSFTLSATVKFYILYRKLWRENSGACVILEENHLVFWGGGLQELSLLLTTMTQGPLRLHTHAFTVWIFYQFFTGTWFFEQQDAWAA